MSGAVRPLSGIRVLDLSRLAPGPYCTMMLADLGAEVIVVGGGRAGLPVSSFARGKRFVTLDLKSDEGRQALHRLAETADVVVEGFRPGVADRIGAGYAELSALNPRLIYCSITGYGQDGPMAQVAGHDLNYLAMTGVLGSIGPADAPPVVPLNLIADFAGGSMVGVIGILSALFEREKSGKGQHIDAAMIDGCLSLMAMYSPHWNNKPLSERGAGFLNGGAPYYRCYRCGDGGYVSVGALEPQFFALLWDRLGQGPLPDQMDQEQWPSIEQVFEQAFAARPRDEWAALFAATDACVYPVLTPDEAWRNEHIRSRHPDAGPDAAPPVPRFSRTPLAIPGTHTGDCSDQVLAGVGLSAEFIERASPLSGRLKDGEGAMGWPPPLRRAAHDPII